MNAVAGGGGALRRALDRARAEVAAALTATGEADGGDLVLAVAEVVANAHRHGRPPVGVEVAVVTGRVRVRVDDAGDGPAHPVTPPSPGAETGRGRWLAAQLADVTERRTPDGFHVDLGVRRPGAGEPDGAG